MNNQKLIESRSQHALKLVSEGMSAYKAGMTVGLSKSAVYQAIERKRIKKERNRCPACSNVLKGDDTSQTAVDRIIFAERERIAELLENQAKRTDDNVGAGWLKGVANYLRAQS